MSKEEANETTLLLFEDAQTKSKRTLHLTLHKKWFDKILSGKKKYEFRLAKLYWQKRLENKQYDIIEFRNGYQREAPMMKVVFRGVQKRKIKKYDFYCIGLGEIIEVKNLKQKVNPNTETTGEETNGSLHEYI